MEHHNPWLSIWTSPRATIARIVRENPNRSLWLLAGIYGFCSLMNMFQSAALGNAMGPLGLLILAIVLAPFWGYICFAVWSAFVTWVGKLFKGQGTFKTIRAAYAWSCVPIVINIPLWLLMVVLFGHQLFLNFPDAHMMPNGIVTLMFVILIVKVALAIWSLVIYLNALAEVQSFSILRAILNVVVTAVALSVILFIIWSLLGHVGNVATAFFSMKLY
ncbi:MAG TPA: Yip1 family protein [Chlamydiales bacterium]|nr:Yip1 family protein [Chlamydiales bacterium]